MSKKVVFAFAVGLLVGGVATYLIMSKITPSVRYEYYSTDYQGIDVSHHQGRIDWSVVATDRRVQFAYVKATEGSSRKLDDERYKFNIREARKNGIKVGAYHLLTNRSSAESQFEHFISVVDKNELDLIPMLDIEKPISKDKIKQFCNLVEKHFGRRPLIYCSNKLYNSHYAPDFNNYYLMIARYRNSLHPPRIKGKGRFNIWQYSEKGRVNGIKGPVDLNKLRPDFSLSKLYLSNS